MIATTALWGVGSAAVAAILSWAVELQRRRVAAGHAAEQSFRTALDSSDLATLSSYLRSDLGRIPLTAYLHDPDIRSKLDRYLTRLAAYVAPPEESEAASVRAPLTSESPTVGEGGLAGSSPTTDQQADEVPAISAALHSLREGDTWSALARLRSDIEARLQALRKAGLADALDLGPPHHGGRFSLTTDVPPVLLPRVRRFWRVASAAVHGRDVGWEAALDAIDTARSIFVTLDELEAEAQRRQTSASPASPPPL